MPGRHKAPLLGWHPPPELAAWAREEAERRGGGRGALSDLLTEALAEKRQQGESGACGKVIGSGPSGPVRCQKPAGHDTHLGEQTWLE